MTCMGMYGSGCRIGMAPTQQRPWSIRQVLRRARTVCFGAAAGTASPVAAAPRFVSRTGLAPVTARSVSGLRLPRLSEPGRKSKKVARSSESNEPWMRRGGSRPETDRFDGERITWRTDMYRSAREMSCGRILKINSEKPERRKGSEIARNTKKPQ